MRLLVICSVTCQLGAAFGLPSFEDRDVGQTFKISFRGCSLVTEYKWYTLNSLLINLSGKRKCIKDQLVLLSVSEVSYAVDLNGLSQQKQLGVGWIFGSSSLTCLPAVGAL